MLQALQERADGLAERRREYLALFHYAPAGHAGSGALCWLIRPAS